ncbi:hypothetical protein [Caballeronia sp. NCTM5]|uniref:hypothetical protein n=1 Tax=Caballeronia sp. NCTM5 TaxID=2921755 RepID=UPI0020286D32|nr:hypothetical protein [Caballeronia sp. NCTM5]
MSLPPDNPIKILDETATHSTRLINKLLKTNRALDREKTASLMSIIGFVLFTGCSFGIALWSGWNMAFATPLAVLMGAMGLAGGPLVYRMLPTGQRRDFDRRLKELRRETVAAIEERDKTIQTLRELPSGTANKLLQATLVSQLRTQIRMVAQMKLAIRLVILEGARSNADMRALNAQLEAELAEDAIFRQVEASQTPPPG